MGAKMKRSFPVPGIAAVLLAACAAPARPATRDSTMEPARAVLARALAAMG